MTHNRDKTCLRTNELYKSWGDLFEKEENMRDKKKGGAAESVKIRKLKGGRREIVRPAVDCSRYRAQS